MFRDAIEGASLNSEQRKDLKKKLFSTLHIIYICHMQEQGWIADTKGRLGFTLPSIESKHPQEQKLACLLRTSK